MHLGKQAKFVSRGESEVHPWEERYFWGYYYHHYLKLSWIYMKNPNSSEFDMVESWVILIFVSSGFLIIV